jgi:hypothetical protein
MCSGSQSVVPGVYPTGEAPSALEAVDAMLTLSADFGIGVMPEALLQLCPILVYLPQRRQSVVAHFLLKFLGSFGIRSSFPVGNPFRLPVRFLR